MTLRFYNTLSRKLEDFEPLEPGHVRIYSCGPTVYERAHIGNFRTFVWEDLLRRYFKWRGYRVTQVMNLTDVDDRTIGAALERGVTLEEVTRPIERQFFEDWQTLGLETMEHHPRATEHIDSMIDLIDRLETAGLAYVRDGSVYFAIDRFPQYGDLAGLDPDGAHAAGRVEGDEEYSKDDPRDFVLWKGGDRSEGTVAVWDSPWGAGRPGWHVECSAMSMQYLGETFDIHTGGVDNIFPHHTNEMAQSEGATGAALARLWLHAEHLLVDGGKMSKSLGNDYTIPYLVEQGFRPSAIRYLLLSAHYRTQLNFTFAGLEKADRSLERIDEFRHRLARIGSDARPAAEEGGADSSPLGDLAERARAEFQEAMDADLGVSDALAALFTMVREGNRLLDDDAERVPAVEVAKALTFLDDFDAVFGVLALRSREQSSLDDSELRAWVESKIEAREAARGAGEYASADAIRRELEERGIVLEDTPDGTRWKQRPGAQSTAHTVH